MARARSAVCPLGAWRRGGCCDGYRAPERSTYRSKRNRTKRVLFLLGDRIRPLVDPAEIEHEACRLLGEELAVDRAYYAEFDAPLERAQVKREYRSGGVPSLIGLHRLSDFAWCLPMLQSGQPIAIPDAQCSDLIATADRAAMAALHIVGVIAAPLRKQGKTPGCTVRRHGCTQALASRRDRCGARHG